MAEMITAYKDQPRNKRVLLFSGGMDSLIMAFLLKPDVLLYLLHGQSYGKQELHRLYGLRDAGYIQAESLIIISPFDFKTIERTDAIIPARNLYFILYAANYGETIYLGSMYGDRSLDKSLSFFNRSRKMLNYLYQDQHWCNERQFTVSAPYKDMTKTELVKKYLTEGGSAEALLASYSCYEGREKPCGVCKPCFRKWVALENNRISTVDYFETHPMLAPWLPELLPVIMKGEYRGREDQDILMALNYEQEAAHLAFYDNIWWHAGGIF